VELLEIREIFWFIWLDPNDDMPPLLLAEREKLLGTLRILHTEDRRTFFTSETTHEHTTPWAPRNSGRLRKYELNFNFTMRGILPNSVAT
jgi:hypothetical protein